MVVFHAFGFGVAVVQNSTVGGYPCDAVARTVKAAEIIRAAFLHALGGKLRLSRKLVHLVVGKIFVQHAHDEHKGRQQHHRGNKAYRTENPFRHSFPSIR